MKPINLERNYDGEREEGELKPPKFVGKKADAKTIIVPKKPLEQAQDSEINVINYRKIGRKFSLSYIKRWIKLKFHEDTSYLINMELNNGMWTTFIVKEKDNGFNFRGKKYQFDDALKYYHMPSKLYTFNFHEGLAIPIMAKFDLNEINKAITSSGITEIEYMTNPSTLERFTVSKIAEGIMKGQQLDAFFRQIRMVVIINVLMTALLLVLFVAKTGMLKSIKIPGLT